MRVNREIRYDNPKIASIVYNLRKIFSGAVRKRIYDLKAKETELFEKFLKDRDKWAENTEVLLEEKEWSLARPGIIKRIKFLEWSLHLSICYCSGCGHQDRPMVYRKEGGLARWMCKMCSDDFFYEEFKINEYLSVVYDYGEINININGKKHLTCQIAVVNLPNEDQEKEFSNMDDFLDSYNLDYYSTPRIPKRTEFWVHCSSLQAWAEHNYDTTILHRNVAFPLLDGLRRVGDTRAIKIFKEEIVKRYIEGSHEVRRYLKIEGLLRRLSKEEIRFIIDTLKLKQDITVFSRKGRYYCDSCNKFSEVIYQFGKDNKETEDTLTLCKQCKDELF